MSKDQKVETGRLPEDKGAQVLLSIKGVLMIAAIALMCSSKDISVAQSSELHTALKSLNLNYTPPCKYNLIKEKSNGFYATGLAALCLNSIFFFFILCAYLLPPECNKYVFCIICIFIPFVAGIIAGLLMNEKYGLDDAKQTKANVDYIRLQSEMLFSLEKHFTSDNTSSSDEISSSWNNFFIKYDCCAVREVQGTTNDFDNTPWCTTSGSCQATASQIPKTCCKDVTQDDYTSAPDVCHASVNPGTYRPSCISRMKYLSISNIDVCQVYMLSFSLLSLAIFQIFEAIVSLGIFIIIMIRNHNKPSPCGGNYTILKFIDCNRSRENEEDHQNAQNVPM